MMSERDLKFVLPTDYRFAKNVNIVTKSTVHGLNTKPGNLRLQIL